jgi:uncharacterized spore protein YtfJ
MGSSPESFQVETVLEAVLGKLRTLAETSQTFGQPITVGDTIIVPYVSLSFGLAGGGGDMGSQPQPHPRNGKTLWGGAGGGVRVEPLGFLVIRGDKVELLTVDQKPNQLGQLAEGLLPLLQQWMQAQATDRAELVDPDA